MSFCNILNNFTYSVVFWALGCYGWWRELIAPVVWAGCGVVESCQSNTARQFGSIFCKKERLIYTPQALGSSIPGRNNLCNPKSNPPNSDLTKQTEKAYIAGIIDGEGCVTIAKRNTKRKNGIFCFYQCLVIIVNTDKKMLDFIANLYGGWINTNHRLKGNQKISYKWVCAGDNMRKLLKDTLPYLRIKKKQAKVILQFPLYEHTGWGWKGGRSKAEKTKQDNLWIRMRKLNHQGKQVNKGASNVRSPIIGP